MVAIATSPAFVPTALRPAVVALVEPGARMLTCRSGDDVLRAILAVPTAVSVLPGDTVLLATATDGLHYALGWVPAARERTTLAMSESASLEVEHAQGDHPETWRLRAAGGAPLFEYEPASGRCAVYAPDGDLVLAAARGAVELRSGESSVRVEPAGATVTAADVRVQSERATLRTGDASVEAAVISTVAEKLRTVAGEIEVRATRIMERARVSYRDAEELAQTRAAQVRTIAREALQMRGRRVVLKAEQDVKVKGEKIHLA